MAADTSTTSSAELRNEIARQEALLALLPSNAVGPSRTEVTRQIDLLQGQLLVNDSQVRAAAEGRTWNGRAFRWARRAGKSLPEAIAEALA